MPASERGPGSAGRSHSISGRQLRCLGGVPAPRRGQTPIARSRSVGAGVSAPCADVPHGTRISVIRGGDGPESRRRTRSRDRRLRLRAPGPGAATEQAQGRHHRCNRVAVLVTPPRRAGVDEPRLPLISLSARLKPRLPAFRLPLPSSPGGIARYCPASARAAVSSDLTVCVWSGISRRRSRTGIALSGCPAIRRA